MNLRAEANRLRSVARELPEDDAVLEIMTSLENMMARGKDQDDE